MSPEAKLMPMSTHPQFRLQVMVDRFTLAGVMTANDDDGSFLHNLFNLPFKNHALQTRGVDQINSLDVANFCLIFRFSFAILVRVAAAGRSWLRHFVF